MINLENYNIDPIIRLEKYKQEETYDIEVEDVHAFYARNDDNNYTSISHNSAHIALMDISHPDVEKFIAVKQGDKNKELTQFNISVRITDKFIEACEADADWDLVYDGEVFKTLRARDLYDQLAKNAFEHNEPGIFNIDTVEKYNNGWWAFKLDRVNPCVTGDTLVYTPSGYVRADSLNEGDSILTYKGTVGKIKTKEINHDMKVKEYIFSNQRHIKVTDSHIFYKNRKEIQAKDLKIGDQLDSFENSSVKLIDIKDVDGLHTVYDFFEESTDSWVTEDIISRGCGEITMPAYSLCCLSSINLVEFVKSPFDNPSFDFEEYKKTIHVGVRFLDNVLDRTSYPLKKIEDLSKKWRRIGLGFTGLGDALAMMKLTYGSRESLDFSEKLAKTLRDESYRASINLAEEKGSFPEYDGQKLLQSNFIKQLPNDIQDGILNKGLRNIALNTCAPNGCLVKDTKIKTTQGTMTIEEIFKKNLINIEDEKNTDGKWIIPLEEIKVETVSGEKRITKLYVNGFKNTLKLRTNSSEIEATDNHHILVKAENGIAEWKRLDEIKIGDKILIKKK